jgi:predicted CXXCH cytochrome family protein
MHGRRAARFGQLLTAGSAILVCTATLLLAQAANDDPPAQKADDKVLADRFLSGLIGSKHDFSESGKHPGDLCLSCHTTHITQVRAPLLDRRPAATQPIRPHQTLGVELDAASLLCLGCHDGSVAPDVYSSGHALAHQLGASSLSADRLRSHPIGVRYPASRKFQSRAAVNSAGLKLPEGRVQCTSCHDPHNTRGHKGMLIRSNERSRLCLSCHRL